MLKLNKDFLRQVDEHYHKLALSFTKEDKKFNACKDTFRGKITGFLTPEYYRRNRLFLEGSITYGYVYRSFQTPDQSDYILTWVITSPEEHYLEHPEDLGAIAEELANIDLNMKTKDRKLRSFIALLQEKYSEFKYIEIPAVYSGGHLAFLSVVPYRANHMADFRHGVNLLVSGKEISKEIFFLPDKYWPVEYRNDYYGIKENNTTKE